MDKKGAPPPHTRLKSRLPADIVLADVVHDLFDKSSASILIAIGGPGGSGKTTFAEKLRRRLVDCGIINLDNYKTARSEREMRNLAGPHPDANRMELVKKHLGMVKSGNSVELPVYDHVKGDTGSYKEYFPKRFTIVEGEISTYPEFRHLIDLSIFIDSDFKTQLAARTGRDVTVLGHSLQKAIKTFLVSNLTAFTQFGAESKQWADIHLYCHDDYHVSIESLRSDLFDRFRKAMNDAKEIDPEGLIVPVATPFEKNLSICQPAFIDHLSYLSRLGVTKLIIGGTTAEFFSLTISERLTLLKLSREYFPGFIMFNITDGSIATTAEMARRAARYGADALICLPPYYYASAPQAGLTEFFKSVACATGELPLYLYNFPKHTGNPITAEILQNVPHAGIKDSAADLSLIAHTSRYLLGGDSMIVDAYRRGACGYVPGLPNVFPKIYLDLEDFLEKRDFDKANTVQQLIAAFKKTLPEVSGIVVIKKYLNNILDGYPVHVRPPLDTSAAGNIDTSVRLALGDL